MALDDFLISTGVDNLIRLVKEKGRIEVTAASRELKLPLKTVEDWAHVLEEEGLITIDYKLTKIYLAWKAQDAEYIEQKGRKLEEKATNVKSDIEMLLSKVDEGNQGIAAMQEEISGLETASKFNPADAQRMKSEIAELDRSYSEKIAKLADRLARLKKRAAEAGAAVKEPPAGKKGKKAAEEEPVDFSKELARLRKFEETIEAQLADSGNFFGSLEEKTEEMKRSLDERKESDTLAKMNSELDGMKALSAELSEAMAAVKDEQAALKERMAGLEKEISGLAESTASPAGRAKRVAELNKLQEEAKRQKKAVTDQLNDALASLKKNSARFEEIAKREEESRKGVDALREEYVEIEEEAGKAAEEIARKRADVSRILAAQSAALDAARGQNTRFSDEEIKKVSFLLRELANEQSMLEGKVRVLLKEAEILKLESDGVAIPRPEAAAEGVPMPEAAGDAGEPHAALVERVKLTQDEQNEFEHKREELRSLIRKMWEENKGG